MIDLNQLADLNQLVNVINGALIGGIVVAAIWVLLSVSRRKKESDFGRPDGWVLREVENRAKEANRQKAVDKFLSDLTLEPEALDDPDE